MLQPPDVSGEAPDTAPGAGALPKTQIRSGDSFIEMLSPPHEPGERGMMQLFQSCGIFRVVTQGRSSESDQPWAG